MYSERVPTFDRITLVAAVLAATLGCVGGSAEDAAEVGESSGAEQGSADSADSGSAGFVDLIDHEAWQEVTAAEDPLADHRPAEVECGLAGWYVEDGQTEVDTNFCNYLSIRQPSLAAIEAGATLELGLYYFDLAAPEPAQAHVAIVVDGEILWEDTVDIPGQAQVYTLEFPSPLSAPQGAELDFHLHNHGQNTWVLQDLRVAAP